MGETSQLFPALQGLYVHYLLRGEIRTAHELAERLLSLAQSVHDAALLLEAHFAIGQTLTLQSEFVEGREHLEQGIALYEPVRHRLNAFLYGQDPGVYCRLLVAWGLCLLGYPDQAWRRNQEALAVAQEVGHPLSLAAAHTFFAVTHQFRREGEAAQAHAETAIELSTHQGFPYFLAFAPILRGWAQAEGSDTEEGETQVREGFAAYRATGAELPRTRFIAMLAEALGKSGQPEEGLNALTEAFAMMTKGGECDYEASCIGSKGNYSCSR